MCPIGHQAKSMFGLDDCCHGHAARHSTRHTSMRRILLGHMLLEKIEKRRSSTRRSQARTWVNLVQFGFLSIFCHQPDSYPLHWSLKGLRVAPFFRLVVAALWLFSKINPSLYFSISVISFVGLQLYRTISNQWWSSTSASGNCVLVLLSSFSSLIFELQHIFLLRLGRQVLLSSLSGYLARTCVGPSDSTTSSNWFSCSVGLGQLSMWSRLGRLALCRVEVLWVLDFLWAPLRSSPLSSSVF